VAVANKRGLGLVRGKMFIDCTGDADVCVRAGAGYTSGYGNSGKNQSVSLRYTVAGVDFDRFGEQIKEEIERSGTDRVAICRGGKLYLAVTKDGKWTFSNIFDRAIAAGDLDEGDKTYWQGFYMPGRPGAVAFNNPEFPCGTDATDPEFASRIQVEGKRHILRQLLFYRKYLRGFGNAYISKIASVVGVRESRNVVTDRVLTAEDIFSRRKFPDMFCQTDYPVDVHGGMPDHPEATCSDGKKWYEIPFGTLVVKGFDNLFVAGRCLGADFMAQSSVRVQQSARSSGEAAGIGAALALTRGCTSHGIDGADVREIMISKGAEYADR
ncbi:MAG: FAD-dependent oxidoreductase, partial [Clostridia bacterium]|nr:FAD-dependent oxidoreductase [Clostridia bacterium]